MSRADSHPQLTPGQLVAGRFRVERRLGAGGMASVWEATDLATSQRIAVKVLHAQLAALDEAVSRLRREAQILSSLAHPCIVRVETYGELDGGGLFIAMELLEGETLGARIRRAGRFEPRELAPIVAQICAALDAAHARGVLHRDLKPDNVFLVPEPGSSPTSGPVQVKLLDFGISKVHSDEKLTQTGEILGTPRYIAPEQLTGEKDIDARADIYSLGVTLYEALAGTPPFASTVVTELIMDVLHGRATPLRAVRPDLPPQLEAVVMRAMARAREARFGSMRELGDAFLQAALGNAPVRAVAQPARGAATALFGGSTGPQAQAQAAAVGVSGARRDEGAVASTAEAGRDGLSPGTFRELRAEAAVPVVAGPPADAPPSGTAPTWDARGPAAAARAQVPAPVVAAPSPANQPINSGVYTTAHAGSRESFDTGSLPQIAGLGRRGPPTAFWVVLGSAFAGAVCALIAIFAWRHTRGDETHSGAAPPTAAAASSAAPRVSPSASNASAAANPAASPSPPTVAPSPSALVPQVVSGRGGGANDLALPSPSPQTQGHESRGRRAHPSTDDLPPPVGPTATHGATTTAAPSDNPRELYRQARAALSAGDAERCLTLVDQAFAQAPSSTGLRLRGDCQLRAGRRDAALASYRRFCLLTPDDPSIGEVRGIVEGLGGSCP